MSWLRLDERFSSHPKLLAFTRGERWSWLEVLCYCATHNTDGRIPKTIGNHLKNATPALLNKAHGAGLVDLDEHGIYHVHDWAHYNPKDPGGAERARRYRDAKRDETRDANRDENVTPSRSRNGPRARAEARVTEPIPIITTPNPAERGTRELQQNPRALGTNPRAVAAGAARADRADRSRALADAAVALAAAWSTPSTGDASDALADLELEHGLEIPWRERERLVDVAVGMTQAPTTVKEGEETA